MATSSTSPAPYAPIEPRVPSAARSGAVAVLPLLAPYLSLALVIGSVVADHGGPVAAWSGSWLIFGGSAHLAAIRSLDQSGPVAAILTGLLINARLLVYSASFARRWSQQPRWFALAGAGLIVDPTWAIAEHHGGRYADLREQRRFFLVAGLTLGVAWSSGIVVGALIGARLEWIDLGIVIPLCLLGLLGAGLREPGTRLVMIAGATTALLTINWPSGTGLLVAVIVGSMAGLAYEKRSGS